MPVCPPEQDLERLLEEDLQGPERGRAEAHVEDCPRCQAILQRLVTEHHVGVPTDLAAVFADSERAGGDAGEEAFLRRLSSSAGIESSHAGANSAPGDGDTRPLPEIRGYEILAEIGRGAVGIVYRARHLELNRLVALKLILAGPFSSSKARQRFRIESQAIARLRHPHIVQVYDIGEQDGCLYLSLELVEGGNLADSIAAGPRPAIESARIAADLAEAIAYAHSHGVIHRDLKPANVLFRGTGTDQSVAESGGPQPLQACELKITDFGLAKVSAEQGGAELGVTLSGEFLGTPSYTAPEQARGDARQAGPQVDVYSLGAMLYELLTGRPPFQGASVVETLLQVAHHIPVPPARLVPGVPRDLDTICSKCLEKDPAQRYATADEVAADLRRFLNHEPILARRIGLPARALRWVRRRPARASLAAGASLVVLIVLAGAMWMGLQSASLQHEVSAHLQELGQRAALADWDGARTALERARARLGHGGDAALLRQVEESARDLDMVGRLDAIRSNRAALAEGRYDVRENNARADREYAGCFLDAGIGRTHEDASLVAGRVRASLVQRALVAALDDWALSCSASGDANRAGWLADVAQRADLDPTGWLGRVRDPQTWKDRVALEQLAQTSGTARPGVQLLLALGARLEAVGGDAANFLQQVQRDHPDDFWANLTLGDVLSRAEPKEAIRYYQAAVAIRPQAAVAYNNLGRAMALDGRTAEALDAFQRAVHIEPGFALAHSNVGNALGLQGLTDEAIEVCREAVRIAPDSPTAHGNLGRALTEVSRWAEAVEELSKAVELSPWSAIAHNNLGLSLVHVGRTSEAIEHCERALQLAPDDPGFHNNMGVALNAHGRTDEAVVHFRRAIELRSGEIDARNNLSGLLRERGQIDEAIELAEQAVRLDSDDASSLSSLGMALLQKGRGDEAIQHLEGALAEAPRNAKHSLNLGIGLQVVGRVDEAIVHYQRAMEIDPLMTKALGPLSSALLARGRLEEARAAALRCLELSPPDDPLRDFPEKVLAQSELALAFEARLPSILDASEAPVDPDEAVRFARLCVSKKLYAGGARLYASAFSSTPALAEDTRYGDRYNAACCAAVTASALGESGRELDHAQRTAWRAQALDWLLAELALRGRRLQSGRAADRAALSQTLTHWLEDPDLAGLRDEAVLAELPEQDRERCRALWNAVGELKRSAEQVP